MIKNKYAALANYLTADYGCVLAVYLDGEYRIHEASYVLPNDVIASIKCPGMHQLDSTYFTEDFCEYDEDAGIYREHNTGRIIGDLEAVIRECVRDGDVEAFLDHMLEALESDNS